MSPKILPGRACPLGATPTADGWAAVLQPPAWTPEKTERLRLMLHANE